MKFTLQNFIFTKKSVSQWFTQESTLFCKQTDDFIWQSLAGRYFSFDDGKSDSIFLSYKDFLKIIVNNIKGQNMWVKIKKKNGQEKKWFEVCKDESNHNTLLNIIQGDEMVVLPIQHWKSFKKW